MFGFAFISATYVLLPIHELRTKFKSLQLMSGLNPMVYCFANFMFDIEIKQTNTLIGLESKKEVTSSFYIALQEYVKDICEYAKYQNYNNF